MNYDTSQRRKIEDLDATPELVVDMTLGLLRSFLRGCMITWGLIRRFTPIRLYPDQRALTTVNSFITMMNGLIEEGVVAMSTYATPGLLTFKKDLKVGLITAITSDEFNDNRHG